MKIKAWNLLMRIKECLCWLITNDVDLSRSPSRQSHFAVLKELEFGLSRTAELRKYAEEEFKERSVGLKEANERLDKLLGLTLVAIGWVGTQTKEHSFRWSLVFLLLSAIILLCGRWKVTSRFPLTFPDFVDVAKEEQSPTFEFDIARAYHKAAYDNGALTSLTQSRLLLAAVFLIAGLVAFALRV